ncbi:MAG: tripartite tricarboxylate transporter substrate binding protein [Betaproteobacteria bacterium]|nr:tripartite tricarboxylate transporter substrate binding protein [Betaproteobacteria bacterium]
MTPRAIGAVRPAQLSALLVGLAMFFPMVALGQTRDYPTRPVRLIVPFPPGGPTDVLARAISVKLTEYWGEHVIVDNRPGAGGNIGTELAARAAPDGHTLAMGTIATHAINESLYARLPYAPQRDFVPVALAAQTPSLVVVHPAVPAKSFAELVALAEAKPGRLNYAHAGVGTIGHLSIELLRLQADVRVTSIPYKGTAPALTDTIGGQTAFMITSMLTALPHVRSGKLRALAVTSAKRSAAAPDIATVVESGYPDYVVVGWAGVFAPARVPRTLPARVNADVNRALAAPDTRQRLLASGSEPASMTSAEFGEFVRAETVRWRKVIRQAAIKPE